MTAPYYQDDLVTLYHGKAEDVLPTLTPGSVDVLLTDPPYFNVKDEDWDRQWKRREDFLGWLGEIIDLATPLLIPSATIWVYAGPLMASSVEREVIDPRFRVLNSIRWVKDAGWHNKAEIATLRRYLSPWEAVILAERKDPSPTPLAEYLRTERTRSGMTAKDLCAAIGAHGAVNHGGAVSNWEAGLNVPDRDAYLRMRDALGPGYLTRPYDEMLRPFALRPTGPTTDVWTFPAVLSYPGKHPCEKPLSMLRHMLDASARRDALILDPFAGSGSTLRSAKDAGVRAIGIEKNLHWCRRAAQRLAQDALDLNLGEAS